MLYVCKILHQSLFLPNPWSDLFQISYAYSTASPLPMHYFFSWIQLRFRLWPPSWIFTHRTLFLPQFSADWAEILQKCSPTFGAIQALLFFGIEPRRWHLVSILDFTGRYLFLPHFSADWTEILQQFFPHWGLFMHYFFRDMTSFTTLAAILNFPLGLVCKILF